MSSSAPVNYKNHTFYIDSAKNRIMPPWFVECTREEAEEVLMTSRNNGTVLMRPHSSFEKTRKYVISMMSSNKRGLKYNHYAVVYTPRGYLIDIDNIKHKPMESLSQVMQLFVSLIESKSSPAPPPHPPPPDDNIYMEYEPDDDAVTSQNDYYITPTDSTESQRHHYVNVQHETQGTVTRPIHEYVNLTTLSNPRSQNEAHNHSQSSTRTRDYYNFPQAGLPDDLPSFVPPPPQSTSSSSRSRDIL